SVPNQHSNGHDTGAPQPEQFANRKTRPHTEAENNDGDRYQSAKPTYDNTRICDPKINIHVAALSYSPGVLCGCICNARWQCSLDHTLPRTLSSESSSCF